MAKKKSAQSRAADLHDEIVRELENSGQSEARAIAECITDSEGYDLELIDAIASNFGGWAAFVRGRIMHSKEAK